MPGAPRTNPAAPRGAQADLAARLRQAATGLQDRLNRRDTLIELIRSVNATLEPRRWPTRCWGRCTGGSPRRVSWSRCRTGRSAPRSLPSADRARPYSEGLERVARWITEHNEEFMSASLATDERLTDGPAVTVAGFPLRCRARTIGALIVLDSDAVVGSAEACRPTCMSALRIGARRPGARARHDAASAARRSSSRSPTI